MRESRFLVTEGHGGFMPDQSARQEGDLPSSAECRRLVATQGYRWFRRKFEDPGSPNGTGFGSGVGEVLSPVLGEGYTAYHPLAVPDLFRQFAGTVPSAGPIRDFANRYGLLGSSVRLTPAAPDWDGTGELLQRWEFEITRMRGAVLTWDAIQSGRDAQLKEYVWRRGEPPPKTLAARYEFNPIKGELNEWMYLERRIDGDIHGVITIRDPHGRDMTRQQAAQQALADMANEQLRGNLNAELRRRGRQSEDYKLVVVPRNLLGAMWWQFARLITGRTEHRACRVCGRLMEVSTDPHGVRSNRVFCSGACKVRDHRAKVREAKRLRDAGRTVAQIAKHFDTTAEAIERWLVKRK